MPAAPPRAAMVLFDIDGTLVRKAGPQHREALEEAGCQISGRTLSMAHIDTHGRTDEDLLIEMMLEAGLSEPDIEPLLPPIRALAEELYQDRVPDIRDRVCAGVPEVLTNLKDRGARLGLVTGNLERIGWRKIERAGLRDFFDFGAFSGMARTRAELVGLAIRDWRGDAVTLVGDHPNDVQAAHHNGVRCVAVATGVATVAELSQLRPFRVVENLTHLDWESLL